MALALFALRISIALSVAAFVLEALIVAFSDLSAVVLVSSGINVAISLGIYWGLKQRIAWVAYVVILFFTLDILAAISHGPSLQNLLNLADAVLSFVIIAGLVRWLRERRADATPETAS